MRFPAIAIDPNGMCIMKDIYVGRQAIFDRKMQVYAYELLFRQGTKNCSNVQQQFDGDSASSEVMINTFIEIGLERVAGPHRVFINLTRNLFLNHPEIPFDKDRVVMELLEDIPVDDQLIEAVTELSKRGYLLALDDYIFDPVWDPLLPLVDIIKVEFPALTLEQIEQGLPTLRRHNAKLLAEKIETEEEYQQCLALGFDLFQGYHFSRPKVIKGQRLQENQLVVLRLLSALNDPDAEIEDLVSLITQDASLSYKILRYINSAAIAMPRKVESIRQAIVLMGLARIRAWASLLALSRMEKKPQEYFTTALVRAHMCEQLVTKNGGCAPEIAFSVGLLSILDLLVDRPIAEIVQELALSNEIQDALIDQQGPAGKALQCSKGYEVGDWENADYEDLNVAEITDIYLLASEHAFDEQQALQES